MNKETGKEHRDDGGEVPTWAQVRTGGGVARETGTRKGTWQRGCVRRTQDAAGSLGDDAAYTGRPSTGRR